MKTSIVLQFHRDLHSFTATPAGSLKSTQNEVARLDKTGKKIEVIFKGATPFETPGAVDELHEHFAEAVEGGRHALNAAYKEFEARAGELTGGRGSKAMRIKRPRP